MEKHKTSKDEVKKEAVKKRKKSVGDKVVKAVTGKSGARRTAKPASNAAPKAKIAAAEKTPRDVTLTRKAKPKIKETPVILKEADREIKAVSSDEIKPAVEISGHNLSEEDKKTEHVVAEEPPLAGLSKKDVESDESAKEEKEEKLSPETPELKPAVTAPVEEKESPKKVIIKLPVTVKDLAANLNLKPNDIILKLMKHNVMATINQAINFDVASLIAVECGYELERPLTVEEKVLKSLGTEDKLKLLPRAPVVTLMGHVDHGKTSLLDSIRKSSVTQKESGGITQHIGAYEVKSRKGQVTFLDTPGHEAFTAMRARGAQATDIVILVVAADDGIMPQTLEAIDHARAAGVPIVVALNKIDKPEADPDKVKKQLMETGLMPEEWGGKTITVGVSAKTGEGIEELLEMLLLEAELLELKADPSKPASGIVIEGKLSKGGGPIATILVQNGTLKPGDIIIAGLYYGKVRAMINDLGHRVKEALPSKPVEVLGINGVPQAGDTFFVVEEDRIAKDIVMRRQEEFKSKERQPVKRITLEDLSQRIKEGRAKELKLIVKADVQGSVEALVSSLKGLETKDVKLDIIHSGVTDVNESDIMLAVASDAIIIGFHVQLTPEAEERVKAESVDVRIYRIIYEAIADIRNAMEGLLEPHLEEVFIGRIEVRQVFKLSKAGVIAGSFMVKGKAIRGAACRLIRDKQKIYEGKVASLKRFKEDVKEVAEGFECGIGLDRFDAINPGDVIEVFEIKKTARKL